MSDPYALCSCGSGKKFRFCCQGIASTLEKAFSQARAGQLDSALRTMDQAVSAEPKNLELRLHKAKLLDALKRRPEAETVLDEAISIDGAFAAAHFQRALWRRQEGEIQGAAILARKAVDLYPLDAKEQIAQVFAFLSQVETQLGPLR
jgi:tetratricopeptide (TPR) repeat protein